MKQPEALRLANELDHYHTTRMDKAAAELRRLHALNNTLLYALEHLLNMTGEPPDRNCSCHISPPCNDCVDYSGWRDAFEFASSVIAKAGEA